jgi:hypothetical protein
MWIFGFSFFTNAAYYMLPESIPNHYYICLGTIPKMHNSQKSNGNIAFIWLLLFTILLHIFTAIRYQVYKYKQKQFVTEQMTEQQKIYCLQINQSRIANFAKNVSAVSYIALTMYIPIRLNRTNPIDFNTYPEYLWLYAFYLYLFPITDIFTALVLTHKNPQLRSYCQREFFELLKLFK